MTSAPAISQNKKKSSSKKWILWVFLGSTVFIIVCGGIYLGIKAIIDSGITKGPDYLFGDQHLKTSVALIELHKIRNGQYPEKLADIKYLGKWDKIHLYNVYYFPSKDRQSYYVEVARGWIGKPKDLIMPEDFWRGTGFDPNMKNQN